MNRIMLRVAVLTGGCAAATAIGLGIFGGPASADHRPTPVRDLISGVVDIVRPPSGGNDHTSPADPPTEGKTDKPHKHEPDRPTPIRDIIHHVADLGAGKEDHDDPATNDAPETPPIDTTDGSDAGEPNGGGASDADTETPDEPPAPAGLEAVETPAVPVGPTVTAPVELAPTTIPSIGTAAAWCSPGAPASTGSRSISAAAASDTSAQPEPAADNSRPQRHGGTPDLGNGDAGSGIPAPPQQPLDALPATTWQPSTQPAARIPAWDRDPAGRSVRPCAPSG